jgi:hypothetical protein
MPKCQQTQCRTAAMASRKGIEPLTPGLGNLCSILLSYRDPWRWRRASTPRFPRYFVAPRRIRHDREGQSR